MGRLKRALDNMALFVILFMYVFFAIKGIIGLYS